MPDSELSADLVQRSKLCITSIGYIYILIIRCTHADNMNLRWPEYPEVKGVFVGGCVERGEGSSFRAKAHAHYVYHKSSDHWICVRSAKRIGQIVLNSSEGWDGEITKPSRLMYHELAHILTDHGHDDIWRKKMQELGQPLTRQYQKKRRKPVIVCRNGIQYYWSESQKKYVQHARESVQVRS